MDDVYGSCPVEVMKRLGLPYRKVGQIFYMDFSRSNDSLYLLQLDWFIEECWKMKIAADFTQEEVADLVACLDSEVVSCERRAKQSVVPAVAKAFRDRGEALKMLRSKVVHKP